ncbi:MAG TPA: hypothetical protein VIT67_21200, partial [Povalibacter sp.]
IRSVRPQAAALAAIAIDQLRARKLVAAQATAAGIRDSATAGHVQRQIVLTQLGMNDLPAARKTAMDIDDKFSQGLALGDVAAAYVRMGDAVSANDVATRARKSQRSQIHARVALARADAGDLNGALVSADKIGDEAERALVYARLGALRAAAGNRQQARQLFADAMALLEKAKARNQAIAWAQLARVAILADEPATAREAMSNAMEAVVQMPVGPPRDEALDLVARNQARMGDGMAALGTSRQVSDRVARALLTRDVVASQSSLSAAEELARQPEVLNDALIRAAALFGVIEVQLLRKGPTRSEPQAIGATIDAARDAVRSVEDVQIRPGALTALAAARLTAGDAVAGSDLFAEALESAALPGGPGQRATACLRMVKALDGRLIFLGQPATADDPRGQPETAPR